MATRYLGFQHESSRTAANNGSCTFLPVTSTETWCKADSCGWILHTQLCLALKVSQTCFWRRTVCSPAPDHDLNNTQKPDKSHCLQRTAYLCTQPYVTLIVWLYLSSKHLRATEKPYHMKMDNVSGFHTTFSCLAMLETARNELIQKQHRQRLKVGVKINIQKAKLTFNGLTRKWGSMIGGQPRSFSSPSNLGRPGSWEGTLQTNKNGLECIWKAFSSNDLQLINILEKMSVQSLHSTGNNQWGRNNENNKEAWETTKDYAQVIEQKNYRCGKG